MLLRGSSVAAWWRRSARFVGGDGGAAGVGYTCAEREALVKEAQAGGQIARKSGRVLGVGVGTHEAARRAVRGVGGFLVTVAGSAQRGGEGRIAGLGFAVHRSSFVRLGTLSINSTD